MNLSGAASSQPSIRIPKQLYCSETRRPFTHCLTCNKYLLQEGISYVIEKSFRQLPEMNIRETIFEYAMCMSCNVAMNASLSAESRDRINAYFQTHTDLPARSAKLLSAKTLRLKPWIDRCLIKDTRVADAAEYQVVVQCDGKNVVFTLLPFAISLEALDEITALLSARSLGEIDDFIGKYFTGPPEVSQILRRRPVLL